MAGMARTHLQEERNQWRLDHPVGFYARPTKKNSVINLMQWECGMPGKEGTPWEGGLVKVTLTFPDTYPVAPPVCRFKPPLFHPNVYNDGTVCLSILSLGKAWKSSITVKQILIGVQELLNNPNTSDAANGPAHKLYYASQAQYTKKIKEIAIQFKRD